MAQSIQSVYDALIVGAGPAGLNAALILGRARRNVLLCDDGAPRNSTVPEMHGFLTRDRSSPRMLLEAGREELRHYPSVEFLEKKVEDIQPRQAFCARLANGNTIQARRVVLATGMIDELPPIKGIAQLWGRSVFVCPHCDGWEFRDRRIAIFGECGDAISLAQELHRLSRDLVLLGVDVSSAEPAQRAWLEKIGLPTLPARPCALESDNDSLREIVLTDDSREACSALFLAVALVQRSQLVARLGCKLDSSDMICVNSEQQTTAPGVYAAGDAAEKVHQVIVAAASGVRTAVALNDDLIQEEIEQSLKVC